VELDLEGKVAIVTGASRGIGRAIAETLAGEGMKLVVAARSADALEDLAGALATETLVRATDLREPDAPADLVDATFARFGRVDLVVNNAGATKRGDFFELTDAEWADGFALKFFGAMRLCRAAWPHLRERRGAVVNIVGVGGRTAKAEFTIGGSVNSALLNLTKALADLGVSEGVRVNAINPGTVATERLRARIGKYAADHGLDVADAEDRMRREMGLARFGEPAEIARVVAFLASPLSAHCQGAIVDVDGGLTRTL
jgi:NAD(P)-dependent dehydrogenase (short-subunit alcohol dehydrogenase family)